MHIPDDFGPDPSRRVLTETRSLDAYRDAKVLVTGGLGFIGSHLAKRLIDCGAHVTIVDSLIPEYGGNHYNVREIADRVSINYSDMRDPWSIRYLVQGKDFIFNLAGQVSHIDSMTDPQTDLDINCKSQLSLLEACRENNPGAVLIFAASRQQYGRPKFLPVTEEHPLSPVDVNGINLVAGERYHLLYNETYGLRAVSLRLTNTYGPHLLMKHGRQGFISVFIRLAIEGKDIQVYGDGSQLRDFTYVSDAVDAFLAIGLAPEAYGRPFNVGGTEPISLLEVGRICQDLAGAGGSVKTVPWPEERKRIDIGSVYLDHSQLTQTTRWRPLVDLREGLAKTIEFYRRHGEHYWN
jgi:UDP-glucose 4-epimerase